MEHNQNSTAVKSFVPKWLIKITQKDRITWLGPLLGILLSLPSIFNGYLADDHFYKQTAVEDPVYHKRAAHDLFNPVSTPQEVKAYKERGILPWWTPKNFQLKFFKPLSSLVHKLQFLLFADHPLASHIFMVLLYGLLIMVTVRLFRNFSLTSLSFGLAILLFAINDVHAYSIGWISATNTILTCLMSYCALLMHDNWRRKGMATGALLGPVFFVLAILSSEGGLGVLCYLSAYVVFIEQGKYVKRLLTVLPYLVIFVVYLVFYKLNHYGAVGSDAYIDPFRNLVSTVLAIFNTTSILSFSQFSSLPPIVLVLSFVTGGTVIAAFLVIAGGWLYKNLFKDNKTACFFGLGTILAILPYTMSTAQDRLLLFSGFGAAGLLGELFVFLQEKGPFTRLQRGIGKLLLYSNTIVAGILFIPTLFFFLILENSAQAIETVVGQENTIIINSPMSTTFMYPATIRTEKGQKWPDHVYLLYSGTDKITVKRTGEKALKIEAKNGWLAQEMDRLSRTIDDPSKPGDKVVLDEMVVTVENCTKDGSPSTVLFYFYSNLDEYKWLKWEGKGLAEWKPPAMNEEVELQAKMF